MSPIAMRTAAALLAAALLSGAAAAADPSSPAGRWTVVEIAGKRLRAPATVNFTRVRWLGINTACGPLWGWYRRSGTALRLHVTGSGRFQSGGSPCRGVDYRLLLGRVRSYRAEADSLVLVDTQGRPVARLARQK